MTVKAHKNAMMNRERDLLAREAALLEKERHLAAVLAKRDAEVSTLQKHIAQIQQRTGAMYTQQEVEMAIRTSVTTREEELRVAIMQREKEVQTAMTKREEEIAEAVRKREQEVCEAWARREAEVTREVETRIRTLEQSMDLIRKKEEELEAEEVRLSIIRESLEEKATESNESEKGMRIPHFCRAYNEFGSNPARKENTPLDEVKNLLTPLAQIPRRAAKRISIDATPTPKTTFISNPLPIETPGSKAMFSDFAPSAMKGVILTSTGEMLETPTPTEFVNIFKRTPKVGLNFATIFDFSADDIKGLDVSGSESEAVSLPPSPSSGKGKERVLRRGKSDISSSGSSTSSGTSVSGPSTAQPPTKIRKASIKGAPGRTSLTRTATAPVFGAAKKTSTAKSGRKSQSGTGVAAPLAEPVQRSKSASVPLYDMEDEENLPSPFLKRGREDLVDPFSWDRVYVDDEEDLPSPYLKRAERGQTASTATGVTTAVGNTNATAASTATVGTNAKAYAAGGSDKCPSSAGGGSTTTASNVNVTTTGTGTVTKKRPSNGNVLRAMAAANNVAGRRGTTPTPVVGGNGGPSSPTRASAARAAQIQADSHHHGRPSLVRVARS